MLRLSFILLMVALVAAVELRGETKKGKAGPASEKSIDFDGDVVEGLNRRPLDSLTATSEDERRLGMGHSYRRNKSFDDESQELSRDLAETY